MVVFSRDSYEVMGNQLLASPIDHYGKMEFHNCYIGAITSPCQQVETIYDIYICFDLTMKNEFKIAVSNLLGLNLLRTSVLHEFNCCWKRVSIFFLLWKYTAPS